MAALSPVSDPEEALKFLSGFEVDTAIRGEAYVRQARVLRLEVRDPGVYYVTRVLGSSLYEVTLIHSRQSGWTGRCSCIVGERCKHVYASLRVILTRTGVTQPVPLPVVKRPATPVATPTVATLSKASQLIARHAEEALTAEKRSKPAKAAAPYRSPLVEKMAELHGRELQSDELAYAKKVGKLYQTFRYSRYLNAWECQNLGLDLGDLPAGDGAHWGDHVRDEIHFWQLLAAAARRGKSRIPEFMTAVSDIEAVEARVAVWERTSTIQRWRQKVGQLDHVTWDVGATSTNTTQEIDLRLILAPRSAVVEIREQLEGKFKALGERKLEQLAERLAEGELVLPAAAEGVWNSIRQRLLKYGSLQPLELNDGSTRRWLGSLLRPTTQADRVLSSGGVPWIREPQPLRWDLDVQPGLEAIPGDLNYRLRLLTADGAPPPQLWAILEGRPYLYLSESILFTGPPWPLDVLPLQSEHLIPGSVVESTAGVQLLHRLGVTLPTDLSNRIERIPVTVSIAAEIQPLHPHSPTEDCVITVRATSADQSLMEIWNGHTWLNAARSNPWSGSRADTTDPVTDRRTIRLLDRSIQDRVPGWMAPLDAKTDDISRQLRVRINKQFPEKFVAWLLSLPPEANVSLKGDLASLVKDPVAGSVRLEATETDVDWFDLNVILDVNDTSLSQDEIQLLLAAKGGYVRLKGKGWTRLKFNFTEEDDERLARLGLSPHELSNEPQRLHALQLADESARRFLPAAQAESIERRAAELKARVTPEIPAGVKADLRSYQRDGFHFLAYLATNRFGGILADDMGLGKTLQTLTWLVWLRAEAALADPKKPHPGPTLVVCPKSVMDNWRTETGRFAPDLRVRSWSASELTALPKRVNDADIHVLNYSQLRQIGEHLTGIHWLAVILDEGQYIKNPTSQTAQMACALKARHRLVLSGTPIENKLLDLWSLMAFAMPGVLGSRTRFNQLYDSKTDPLARRRLSARVRPFLLRRTKSQVAQELPARIEEDLYCELEGEQEILYRAELKRAQQILLNIATDKHLAEQRFHLLTSLLRLRQICCHPALLLGAESINLPALPVLPPDAEGEATPPADAPKQRGRKKQLPNPGRLVHANSAKLESLIETLETLMEEGAKVLVFSQFVALLELLQAPLKERGWKFFLLTGATENRGEMVQQFQTYSGSAIFLISLKAGGSGLNLTAASYVFLFDPWWNPAVENQAIDRTHRIGQTQRVVAYRLLMKDTIEEKIRALQKTKSSLADDVLGEEKFSQSLTLSDLRYLLAG